MYREQRAPDPLAATVECFWVHEAAPGDAAAGGSILPDGRVDVVWTAGGQILVAGPQTRHVPRPLVPPFLAVGARFHPGAGPALLGLAAHELVDAHVPLEAIDTRAAARLRERLAAAPDATAVVAALAAFAANGAPPDPLVRSAARLLDSPRATVAAVAGAVALSDRQLQRRFRDAVGYAPKTLQRVLRFQRFLGELERTAAARDRDHGRGGGAGGLARGGKRLRRPGAPDARGARAGRPQPERARAPARRLSREAPRRRFSQPALARRRGR